MNTTEYKKPNLLTYKLFLFLSSFFTRFVYKTKYLRNDIKNVKGPYLLLCNHESALDILQLANLTKRRQTFVISKSFYDTLSFKWLVSKMNLIPKQQFQTEPGDILKMRNIIKAGEPLTIFPAGLMPENGLSTHIPFSTYKFIKFLNCDVYVSRLSGTYFVNAKWQRGLKPGRTFVDTYKLISKEDITNLSLEQIQQKVEEALVFDAYYDQEKAKVKYKNGDKVEGLEKVLYQCPHCHKEGTIEVKNKNTLCCKECGYSETMDTYGFLHVNGNFKEFKHVSKWDQNIYDGLRNYVLKENPNYEISSSVDLYRIDERKGKFVLSGSGELKMNKERFEYKGSLNGEDVSLTKNLNDFFALPSSPVRNSIEVQSNEEIYRFILKDKGTFVVKWVHLLKIFYELNNQIDVRVKPKE